jgi:uncharacterized protein
MARAALGRIDHRPWPLPAARSIGRQTWHDVLFAHWPVPAAVLQPLVPSGVTVQECEGSSWVSLVPFFMSGVTLRGVPAVPGLSSFAEMNLRLYVEFGGRSGIWFISLDAASRPAVWFARRFVHLPYFAAAMRVVHDAERIRYASHRRGKDVVFRGTYGPAGPVFEARRGGPDHFLTERYALFTTGPRGDVLTLEIHHGPWPLQRATADIETNTVAAAQGIAASGAPALLHFSRRQDVVVWRLERARP